jgi:Pentapeptide repeats (8 copies)
MRASEKRWYVKRGTMITGPFTAAVMVRNIVLGRVKPDDLVSRDGGHWGAAAQTWKFESVAANAKAFAHADERQGERRRGDAAEVASPRPRTRGADRRRAEPLDLVRRREISNRVWQGLRRSKPDGGVVWVALTVVILAVVGLSLLTTPAAIEAGDCASGPHPGVNWDSCTRLSSDLRRADLSGAIARSAQLAASDLAGANLSGADFAYADLRQANLELADLTSSRLVGTDLREANFAHADLRSANLQFADLRGARLDGADLSGALLGNTIWPTGEHCRRGSVGVCVVD